MTNKKWIAGVSMYLFAPVCFCQVKWIRVDSLFGPLPALMHVYKTTDSIDGKPNIAYYAEIALNDKTVFFTTDTTYQRRLTPSQFYEKNNRPLLVVNGTFFSFQSNQNLNVVIKKGKLLSYNMHTIPGKGNDTGTYRHPLSGAIGITKKRRADVAWLYTDSFSKKPYATPYAINAIKDTQQAFRKSTILHTIAAHPKAGLNNQLSKWKMQTAIGGGPVLVQQGEIKITNNEELKFIGKARYDKHPRTAMGYTQDGRLIVLVVQGRFPGLAEGVNLEQQAALLKDLGCWEALNLDGGGSSCMLINGKTTIQVSDKEGQRPVPAVFLIHQ
jgi:exopolysaccharide biosynthesis protein